MTELTVGDQTIRYDREATAVIYAGLPGGWAEACGCVGCRNLMVQREAVYPPEFRALLESLGIDWRKEGEAVADGPLDNGLVHYGGWFFFVGEMVTAGDGLLEASQSPYFAHFFTRGGPPAKAFHGGPRLAVEFIAHFPWVLEESWESGLRAAGGAALTEEQRRVIAEAARPRPA